MVQETVITVSLSRLGVISVTAGRRYCWWPTFPHASLSFSHSVSLLPQRSFQVFFPPLLSSPLLTHPGASVSLGLQSTPNSLPYPTAHSLWNKLSLSYSRRHSDTLPLMVFLLPPVTATPYYPQGNLSSFWWQVYPSCLLHFDPFLRFDLFFKKKYIFFKRTQWPGQNTSAGQWKLRARLNLSSRAPALALRDKAIKRLKWPHCELPLTITVRV